MRLITSITILLTINYHVHGQTTLEKHLNNSVLKDSIDGLRKYFINNDYYFDFKKVFQNHAEFTFIQKNTLSSSNVKIHYIELKSKKQPGITENFIFFTETESELINFFLQRNEYPDSINEIISRNYLSHNFRQLSRFPENQKSQKLDSIGKTLPILFTENKDTFLLKYFRPEVCDNSIGDTWFMRNLENKVEIIKVEFNESFYDEKLKCGIIKLSITFSNNDIESDILYFRNINNSFKHFQTSLNSHILRCLK